MTTVYITLFFICGLLLGSYLNAAALRYDQKSRSSRSCCPVCGTQLGFFDLVPVVSYIVLRGKCRHCKAKISPRYLITELLGGLLSVILMLQFGFTLQLLLYYVFTFNLFYLSIVDLAVKEIPDRCIVINLILGIFSFILFFDTLHDRIAAMFLISLPLAAIFTFNENVIGGGDIKLFFSFGAILGTYGVVITLFASIILAGIIGITLMLTKNYSHGDTMSLGNFIAAGAVIAIFFAPQILAIWTF